jgi:hypothetical protein
MLGFCVACLDRVLYIRDKRVILKCSNFDGQRDDDKEVAFHI